jgi:hypothetical protein
MKLSVENPGEGQSELAALFPTTIALIHVNRVLDHVFRFYLARECRGDEDWGV